MHTVFYEGKFNNEGTFDPEQLVNSYLPESFRLFIEQNYYEQVTQQAYLEHILENEAFLNDPINHIALYSDHGVVHVRNVAQEIIIVLNRVNGVLIPFRESSRMDFMQGYGVAVAYLHDIGMRNFSHFGRFMHPEYAAQAVFSSVFDPYLDLLWNENAGNLSWRLLNLTYRGLLEIDPKIVLREMLAMSMCHSKSKVPIEALNHPTELRSLLKQVLKNDLQSLYYEQQLAKAEKGLKKNISKEEKTFDPVKARAFYEEKLASWQEHLDNTEIESRLNQDWKKYYKDLDEEAFLWLDSPHEEVQDLACDVIDALRCLRCADALRQRGTVYRTSAGYEVFVDQRTANAIYALRNQDNSQLFLYEAQKPLNAGEANLASSELDKDCNLRVSFHRGSFASEQAVEDAVFNAAIVLHDIQADVIVSFMRGEQLWSSTCPQEKKLADNIEILIEGVEDNEAFAPKVCQQLSKLNEGRGASSRPVASLHNADLEEVTRYLNGETWEKVLENGMDLPQMLSLISHSGYNVNHLDLDKALKEVRVIVMEEGEVLIKSGSPSGFVYIPFSEGLQVFPMGGYTSVPARAWVPIGNTGVIRGSIRNANVVAEKALRLLVIPRQVYLRHWYQTYDTLQLTQALKKYREKS